ncbi:MAG: Na+/H+ antiporter subunit E [Lachnospiraceae bacterium]|nr:Na+/H+ antiporter subunit E [Lachnospiraceae bacterium]
MFFILLFLWIVFNGKVTLEIILFGLAFSAAVYYFLCKFFDYGIKRDIMYISLIPMIIGYIFVLIKEIMKANIGMLPYIFTFKQKQKPVIFSFKTRLKSEAARAVFANSITLTPGTITIKVEGDIFTIHAFDESMRFDDIIFEKLLLKIEEKATKALTGKEERENA